MVSPHSFMSFTYAIKPNILLIYSNSFINLECNLSEIGPNVECVITVKHTGTKTDKKDFDQLHVSGLQLFVKDTLTVTIGKDNQTIKYFADGLLILPKQDTFLFYVNTSADPGIRKVGKLDLLNEKKQLSIEELRTFTVLIKQGVDLKDNPITLSNGDDSSAVLLSSESTGINASSADNGEKASDTTNLDEKDFLTANKKINLSFKLNTTVDNFFNFNLMKANKNCSQSVTVDKGPVELKTIDKNSVLSRITYTCVYLVTSSAGSLQVDKFDFKTISSFDTILIKDGLKLTSEDLIYSRTKEASKYLNQLDKSVSSTPGLLVVLSSSFIPENYEQSTVSIKPSSVIRISKEETRDLQTDKESIYIFALPDKYPELTFNDGKTFKLDKTDLRVYDSLDLSGEPVLAFNDGEIVNSQLWSEKRLLVLKFTSSTPLKFKVKLEGKTVNCNKISSIPSSYTLTGSKDLVDQTCSFYFKPNVKVNRSVSLNLESLILNAEACLSLRNVNDQTKIFNICQKKELKDSLERIHLPELILPSNNGYVLTYQEKEQFQEKILVQASFAYNGLAPIRLFNLTKDQPTQNITSYNYPNNYPYILNTGEMDSVSADSYLFVTFDKYDLRVGDELKVYNSGLNRTLDDIDDFIVGDKTGATLPIALSTSFNGNKSLTSDQYASGFKIDLERIDCVLNYDPTTGTLQTPGFPKASNFTTPFKCVSVINLSEKVASYFNVTIQNGRDVKDFGRLTIYDDGTVRRNISTLIHGFNQTVLKSNETLNFNLTSSKVVLIFESDKITSINGFHLTIGAESEFLIFDLN